MAARKHTRLITRNIAKLLAAAAMILALVSSCDTDAGAPDITVRKGSIVLAAGVQYDFGEVAIGESTEVTFTIINDGFFDPLLLVGAQSIAIGGSDAESFSLISNATTTIPAGGTSTFAIMFEPVGTAGERNALISIYSNDPDESTIVFAVVGMAIETIASVMVTYDGNGNTGGTVPVAASATVGSSINVSGSDDLLKTGYIFAGWNTTSDGSGTAYVSGSSLTIGTINITLYAQWNPDTYTVTYDGNGNTSGTAPTSSSSAIGGSITVSGSSDLLKTGYTFSGWNTASDGSGDSYAAEDILTVGTTDITLYSQWNANTYTITYDGNGETGGTAPTDGSTYQQSAVVTVQGNNGSLSRTGYTFAGWNTASDGSGTAYAAGSTLIVGTDNVTLYVNWVDTVPLLAPIVSGMAVTSDTTPTWNWSSGGGGNGTFRYELNDSDLSSGATVTTSEIYTPSFVLSTGIHTLYVQERDAVGNWSSAGSLSIEIVGSGSLDTSFGTNGIAITHVGDFNDSIETSVIDPSGRITVAGWSSNGSDDAFALARYHSDGSPDTTFGTNGVVVSDLSSGNDLLYSIDIDANGKYVVSGRYNHNVSNEFIAARYHENGSIDAAFGNNGYVTINVGLASLGGGGFIDTNGKIVVSGYHTTSTYHNVAIVRYTAAGILDSSFGTNGVVSISIGNYYDRIGNAYETPGGKYVIAGYSSATSASYGNNDFSLARFNNDGSLDSTFGGDGRVITPITSGNDYGTFAAFDANDRIIQAGSSADGSTSDATIVRLNTDGSLDSSFGGDGIIISPIGNDHNSISGGVALDASGRLVVAGYTRTDGVNLDFFVARYNVNGTFDTSFGSNGYVVTSIGSGDDVPRSLVIDAMGRIVVAGKSADGGDADFVVVRYWP